ncbi:MAG: cytochrome P450 [Anaerolineales bacterium]|nr:cytochrome P450 [Anaerolineales bacterium]
MIKQVEEWEIGRMGAPKPPLVPGLPGIGIAHKMFRDPLAYFVRLYHQYGPIFRIRLFNRDITVMAGIDANRFLNRDGNSILNSEMLFGSFGREFNTDIFLTAMDGPEHKHLRKQSRRGYSRSAMMPHLDQLIQIVDRYTDSLEAGDKIDVLSTLQFLVTQQLGVVIAGRTPENYFPDLQRFLNYNINVKVLRMWPELMMQMPAYKRSKARVIELGKEVLAAHRANPTSSEADAKDLIDDLLQAKDWHGEPYDEAMLLAATVGPYFAGIDTVASSLSFLVYTVLKHPQVLAQVRKEVEQVFANGTPSLTDLKDMETLHGAAVETLRMYPVAPFTPRVTKEPFEFHGYQVEAESEIFFAQTVTHYLPEFYPKPHRFDPMRFAKGAGRGVPGAFAPYTLGAHLCLGAGIAEAQMMLILARLLHNLELSLESPAYEVTIHAAPLPNPGRKFKVLVVQNRTKNEE